jgi:hypothetical protein
MDQRADLPRHPSSEDLADLRRRLAETYVHGAEVLEQTARLADELAEYQAREGRKEYAAHERAEAAKARDAAARLFANAQRLR